jgi:hypothetical protein
VDPRVGRQVVGGGAHVLEMRAHALRRTRRVARFEPLED